MMHSVPNIVCRSGCWWKSLFFPGIGDALAETIELSLMFTNCLSDVEKRDMPVGTSLH